MKIEGMWTGVLKLMGVERDTEPTRGAEQAAAHGPQLDRAVVAEWLANLFGQGSNGAAPQEAEAGALIAKHKRWGGLDLDEEGLGVELAARVGAEPGLVRAVYEQLSATDQVEVARAMMKRLSDDELRALVWTQDGRRLLYEINRWVATNALTGDGQAHAAEDRRLRERIGVALTRTDDVTWVEPVPQQTGEVKRLFTDVKGTAALNQKLLEIVNALDPPPAGMKSGGVKASEAAAKEHSENMRKFGLKAKFERLGEKYGVPPALIAAIASRESGMGGAFKDGMNGPNSIFYGWGDWRKDWRKVEYRGFGLIQIDKYSAPFEYMRKELQAAYGQQQLDPFDEKYIEWGVKCFLQKYAEAQNKDLSEANQFATAVSRYNGGYRDKRVVYPENDRKTTGHDYGNDVLARARWYAEHWEQLP